MISYQEVCKVLRMLNISEGRPNNKQLCYENMSLKSIRIINRIVNYLTINQLTYKDLLEDIIQNQKVKTGNQNIHQVEIFEAKSFFDKIHSLNLRKSSDVCENLCEMLCINKKYGNLLMFKKLKKCIGDFKTYEYFSMIGEVKNKINLEAY